MANRYAQATAIDDNLRTAIEDSAKQVCQEMIDGIDVLILLAAGYTPSEFEDSTAAIKKLTGAETVIGCSCESVIGGSQELEQVKAVTIWAAKFSNAEIVPMHLAYQRSASESAFVGWPAETDGPWPDDSLLLVLGEPFGFPIDVLLERFNEDRPGVRIAGGMASGAHQAGEARLLLNDVVHKEGLVAIRISGVPMQTVVSQGCRPIGEPMVIIKSERNVIETLGGKTAFAVIQELFQTLPTKDQKMVQSGLHVGIVINEYQEKFEYGDFLIRNVIGIDQESGAISIGDYVRPGQTIQFHIRDHESATAELDNLLSKAATDIPFTSALLFTCSGRGLNMFPEPNHDAELVQSKNCVPLAGFFAAGEVGPIGERNFLHGFTASLVLFG